MNISRTYKHAIVCRIWAIVTLVFALCGIPFFSFGAAGDLDPTFGFGGTGIVESALNNDAAGILELSDGKILVTGKGWSSFGFTLTRYNSDGSLDTTFNETGRVSIPFGSPAPNRNISVLSDGRIVVVGAVPSSFGRGDLCVVRFNPDGTLDTSFNGTGRVQTDIEDGDDSPLALVVQGNGKIVVTGYSNSTTFRTFLIRYNADGNLDSSFNGTGKIIYPESENIYPNALAIQKDGKIVMAGNYFDDTVTKFTVRRYNTNGTPDTSLNGSGVVNTAFPGHSATASTVAIMDDGRIVAGGSAFPTNGVSNSEFALARYMPNGNLDTSFNGTGRVITPIGAGFDSCYTVAVQRSGQIVAVGATEPVVSGGVDVDVALLRYDVDGTLDSTFGIDGKRIVDFGQHDYVNDTALQSDQKILVAASFGSLGSRRFAVMRFVGVATAAKSKSYTTNEDTAKAITLSGTGFQNPLDYIVVTQPQHGTLSGTAPDLTYTPSPDYYGTDNFTFKVNDGGVDSNVATVSITVTPVNDTPTLSALPNVDIFEDAALQTVSFGGITTGALNEDQSLAVSATSSNPALIAQPTVSYSSPNGSGTLSFRPQPNAFGSATITVTVDDGQLSNRTVTRTFTVNIASVNDAPTFQKGADQTVVEDSGTKTVNGWATQMSIGPANEIGQTREFIVSTDNQVLFSVPPAVSSAGVLTFVPSPDAHGSATVTVQVRDSGGTANGGVNTSAPQSFAITVLPSNDMPSFVKGADQVLQEDAAAVIPGWATQLRAGPLNEIGQELTFIVNSDNPALFANTPDITPSGTLVLQPAANAHGSALVSVRIRDNGGTANGGIDTSTEQTFTVSVNSVNDAPSFTAGSDVSVLENSGERIVSGWATGIQKGPANEVGQSIEFVVTHNNAALFTIPPRIAADGTLSFTPAENANGSARVSVQLKDDGGTANGGGDSSSVKEFRIDVLPVNNAPSFVAGGNIAVAQDAGPQTISNWATQISAGPANESGQLLQFTINVDRPELFSQQPAISPSGTLTFTPVAEASGTANVQVILHDDGGTLNGGVDSSSAYTFKIAVTTYIEELGVYHGLVTAPPGTPQTYDRSGLIRLAVRKGGVFSGTLRLAGKTNPLRGTFDKAGHAHFAKTGATELTVARKNHPPLTLTLRLDVSGETGRIHGELKEDGVLFAAIEATRTLYTARQNPDHSNREVAAELQGKYTIVFTVNEPDKDVSTYPQGDGIGTLSVRSNGIAVLSGTLADGTLVSFSGPISEDNKWPLYVTLDRNRGAICGWVRFQDVPGVSDLSGDLHWFKPANPSATFYPNGWYDGIRAHLIGSKFEEAKTAPGLVLPGLEPVSSFGNAKLEFTKGGLPPQGLTQVLNLDIYSRVSFVLPELSNLRLKFGKHGYFSGTVVPDAGQRPFGFKGVILQKQKLGSGFFKGDGEIGAVTLNPLNNQ